MGEGLSDTVVSGIPLEPRLDFHVNAHLTFAFAPRYPTPAPLSLQSITYFFQEEFTANLQGLSSPGVRGGGRIRAYRIHRYKLEV